jgi:hypothetical protein
MEELGLCGVTGCGVWHAMASALIAAITAIRLISMACLFSVFVGNTASGFNPWLPISA